MITSRSFLWNMISYPCPWSLILAHKSSTNKVTPRHTVRQFSYDRSLHVTGVTGTHDILGDDPEVVLIALKEPYCLIRERVSGHVSDEDEAGTFGVSLLHHITRDWWTAVTLWRLPADDNVIRAGLNGGEVTWREWLVWREISYSNSKSFFLFY